VKVLPLFSCSAPCILHRNNASSHIGYRKYFLGNRRGIVCVCVCVCVCVYLGDKGNRHMLDHSNASSHQALPIQIQRTSSAEILVLLTISVQVGRPPQTPVHLPNHQHLQFSRQASWPINNKQFNFNQQEGNTSSTPNACVRARRMRVCAHARNHAAQVRRMFVCVRAHTPARMLVW